MSTTAIELNDTNEQKMNSCLYEQELFITIHSNGEKVVKYWNVHKPFYFGNPKRYELSSNQSGFIIKDLFTGEESELNQNEIDSGELISNGEISFTINPVSKPKAVFQANHSNDARILKSSLCLSLGSGSHIHEFKELNESYTAKLSNKKAFKVTSNGKNSLIESFNDHLTVCIGGNDVMTLRRGHHVQIDANVVQHVRIDLDSQWWVLNNVANPDRPNLENVPNEEIDQETILFKKMGTSLLVASFVFFLLTTLNIIQFSKPEEQKIVLSTTTVDLKKPTLLVKKVEEKKKIIEPKKVIEPKKIVEAPKPKIVEKKIAKVEPKKSPKKKEMKKIVKNVPKPAPAPLKAVAPKVVQKAVTKPVVQKIVQAPKATSPSPAQIKAKEIALAKANVAKSLSFLSAPTANKNAIVLNNPTSSTKYKNIEAASSVGSKSNKTILSSIANGTGSATGVISTKSARGISSDSGISGVPGGRGKALNDVQGKVTLSALYDPNAGEGMGSSLGGSSFSISGSGKVSDAAILKILEKNMQKFQYCYEKALLKNASLAGQLTMEWTIETSGSTTHVKVVKSQLNNGSLHQCMNTELSRISFPNPKGGAVIVKYPFAFSSSQI